MVDVLMKSCINGKKRTDAKSISGYIWLYITRNCFNLQLKLN